MADNLTIFDPTLDHNAPDVFDGVNRMMLDLHVASGLRTKVAHTPTTSVTELSDDVKFFENNFYIPTGVTEFSFTDDAIIHIWTWNVGTTSWDETTFTSVAYTPTLGAITEISDGVTHDGTHFTIPTGVTSFTFTEGTTDMTATFSVDTWSFAEAIDPAEALLADGSTARRHIALEEHITHGSPVTIWNDISGNGLHLEVPLGSTSPTWDSVNQEVIFDGVDNKMEKYNTGDAAITSQPVSIFIVVKKIAPKNSGSVIKGNTTGNIYQSANAETGTMSINMWGGSAASQVTPFPEGEYCIIRGVMDGANSYLRINESTKTLNNIGTIGLNGNLIVGEGSNNAYKEIIVRNESISDSDSDLIYNKLIADHSIIV